MVETNQTVEGEIISLNLMPYEIEVRYSHATSRQISGLVAKHSIRWRADQRNWLQMQLDEVEKRLIRSELHSLTLNSSGAQFQIGDEVVEVLQEGPTEYLELWWGDGDLGLRRYI